jgi:hypothetical protein
MPGTYRSSEEFTAIREHVFAQASTQGQVFRRDHLSKWGVDPQVTRTFLSRGWWHRLRHGVYVDASVWDANANDDRARHLIEAAGAIHALPLPGYAFGLTAALAQGLSIPGPPAVIGLIRDINMDTRGLGPRLKNPAGVPAVRMRCHRLHPDLVTTAAGIPCVVPSLAAMSAAAECTSEWAVAVMDSACWQRPDAQADIRDLVDDWPMMKGIGTVRRALPLVRTGAQTPLESISRILLVRAGLPEPELQAAFRDRGGLIGYADMYWPGMRVIGEADGLAKYSTREDVIREKIREDRLRALGLSVVRWTWAEITAGPNEVAGRVRAAGRLRYAADRELPRRESA